MTFLETAYLETAGVGLIDLDGPAGTGMTALSLPAPLAEENRCALHIAADPSESDSDAPLDVLRFPTPARRPPVKSARETHRWRASIDSHEPLRSLRIARLEANLERLVEELDYELARLSGDLTEVLETVEAE